MDQNTIRYQIWRVGQAILGKWHPDAAGSWLGLQDDRQSPYKGYFIEITHAAKNVVTEILRATGIYDRGGKLR